MGGRGASFSTAREIVGQYSLLGVTDSKSKIVSFYRDLDKNGGIRLEQGTLKVSKKAYRQAGELANALSERMVEHDTQAQQDYQDIRRMMSGSYQISDQDRSNIPDFNAYARSGENFISIRRNGRSLDSAYQELAQAYPHYFNADRVTNPADQLQDINRVLGQLKNSSVPLPESYREEAAKELRDDIIRGYYSVIVNRRSA